VDYENPEEMKQVYKIYEQYFKKLIKEFPAWNFPIGKNWFLPWLVGHNMSLNHLVKEIKSYKIQEKDEIRYLACLLPYPITQGKIWALHIILFKRAQEAIIVIQYIYNKLFNKNKPSLAFLKGEKICEDLKKFGFKKVAEADAYEFLKF